MSIQTIRQLFYVFAKQNIAKKFGAKWSELLLFWSKMVKELLEQNGRRKKTVARIELSIAIYQTCFAIS